VISDCRRRDRADVRLNPIFMLTTRNTIRLPARQQEHIIPVAPGSAKLGKPAVEEIRHDVASTNQLSWKS
jgi:hypothetical protein